MTFDPHLQRILAKIKSERNLDFSQYRQNLLSRRIMTRVVVTKQGDVERYYKYLVDHPEEMDLLMNAMTINVTEFFRDAHVFDVIEKRVIPDLISKKRKTLNVWSCGCASGEEAYSILMLIAEYLGPQLANYKLTIFGTDIDEHSLVLAQQGVFDISHMKKLSARHKKIIEKYFYHIGGDRFWIREEMVPYVKFRYHDVATGKPFENLDLILCRNIFIYFDRELQERVVRTFHKALNKGGFYVMGNVESLLGPIKQLFEEYDKAARIYVKK